MNNQDEKFEQILNQAIELREEGKSLSEIFVAFPNYRNDLQDMFFFLTTLQKAISEIIPRKELLNNILLMVDRQTIVTKPAYNRYLFTEGVDGRISLINKLNNQIQYMIFNWKIILPLGLLVIVAIMFFSSQSGKSTQYATNPSSPVSEPTPRPTPSTALAPVVKGNIDNAVNAFLSVSSGELAVLEEENGYEASAESSALNEFGQSYVENEL